MLRSIGSVLVVFGLLLACDKNSGPPPGTGKIHVLVETTKGEPLAGVLIRANRNRYEPKFRDRSGRPPIDRPIEELVREFAEETLRERAKRVEAVTGEDGTCELTGLADDYFEVHAYRVGWRLEPEPRFYFLKPGGEVRFQARRLVALPVTVRLPDETEPPAARIELHGPDHSPGTTWMPDHRLLWVPPGDHRITVTSGRFRKYVRRLVPVKVRLDEKPEAMVVSLKARLWIRGRVIPLPTDTGIPGKLRYLRIASGEATTTARILDREESEEAGMYAGHHFRIDRRRYADLASGRWLVALVEDGEVLARTVVELKDGVADCELRVPEPDPENHLIVTVLGREKRRHRWLSIHSRVTLGEDTTSGPRAVPMRDGRFRVRHARPKGEGEAKYTLLISSRYWDRVEVPYRSPEDRELTVNLADPTSLHIYFKGYEGSRHEGAIRVTFEPAERRVFAPAFFYDRPPDAEGNWYQERCVAGEYELLVRSMPTRSSRITLIRKKVTVKPGENRIDIPFPTLHVLTILSDVPRVRFALKPMTTDKHDVRTSFRSTDDGKTIFEHLPAGRYEIHAAVPGRETEQVVVRISETTEYRYESKDR